MPWSYSQNCFGNCFGNYSTIYYVNIHLVLAGFRQVMKIYIPDNQDAPFPDLREHHQADISDCLGWVETNEKKCSVYIFTACPRFFATIAHHYKLVNHKT